MNKPRLIDANELIEYIVNTPSTVMNEIPYEQSMFTNIQDRVNEILDAIENQPTAYDIDKVVKELINHTQECTDRTTYETHSFVPLFEAIKIVKGGAE
jgi:hypothetical protein